MTIEIIDPARVTCYQIQRPSQDRDPPKEKARILVGITRIWTDRNYRRKQIASRLCDMVRFHSGIPGCILTRDQLGILEPSEDGKIFFYNYTGGMGGVYSACPV